MEYSNNTSQSNSPQKKSFSKIIEVYIHNFIQEIKKKKKKKKMIMRKKMIIMLHLLQEIIKLMMKMMN